MNGTVSSRSMRKAGRSVLTRAAAACAVGLLTASIGMPLQAVSAYADEGASAQEARLQAGASGNAIVESQAQQACTLPVKMLKRGSDDPSMASPVMHPVAYAEPNGDAYTVKVYFVNAPIMGSTIFSGSLGEATYDKAGDGNMVPVESDVYDKRTQVKTVTMTLTSLEVPVEFHLGMFMDSVRLVFDTQNMVEAAGEPQFPQVASSVVKYPVDSVAVIGGSGYDGANALARCSNGLLVVAGDTSSADQSFAGRSSASGQTYLTICSPEGEVLSTSYLTGADTVGTFGLSAASDGSFFVCGYFQMSEGAATGDFEGLTVSGTEGTRNAYVAKYSANNKLQWIKSVCNTQACQYDGVAATPDGGCIAVAEYLKGSTTVGDYADEVKGIVNTIVVKYDASGAEEWHTVLTGSSVIDTDGAVAVTPQGTYLVAGSFAYSSAEGMLSSLERFGGTFDMYAVELDAEGKLLAAHCYGGSGTNESAGNVIALSDGGFALAGYTASGDGTFASSPASANASNGFMLRCNADGTVAWADTYKSTQDNEARQVVQTDEGFAVIGSGEGKDGDFTELAKGQHDVYVALYDAEGHRTSLRTFGGSKNESAAGIAAASDGQYVFLVESASSDVDMQGLSRGESDAVLVWSSKKASENAQAAADAESAAIVEGLLNALPEAWAITDADKNAVAAARAEFDALSVEATALVPADAVAKLQLAEKAAALSSENRQDVTQMVEAVQSLPANPGIVQSEVVSKARASYEAFSAAQKELVPSEVLDALAAAEKSVAAAEQAKKVADEKAAKEAAEKDAHTIDSAKTAKASMVYTGKALKPAVTVTARDGSTVAAANYTVAYANNVKAGTARVTVIGKGAYSGIATATFKVTKATTKAQIVKSKTFKASSLKNKAKSFDAVKLTTDGKVTWKVVKKDAKKALTFKKGKVTVKKGAKAGTYTVKVKASAKAGKNYKAFAAKTYTIKVRVK